MVLLGALVLILGSFGLLMLLRIQVPIRQITSGSREALQVMRDPELDDREKEKRVQALSLRTFRASFLILGQLALALGLPYLLVLGLSETGAWSLEAVVDRSLRWDLIVGATVLALVLVAGRARGAKQTAEPPGS